MELCTQTGIREGREQRRRERGSTCSSSVEIERSAILRRHWLELVYRLDGWVCPNTARLTTSLGVAGLVPRMPSSPDVKLAAFSESSTVDEQSLIDWLDRMGSLLVANDPVRRQGEDLWQRHLDSEFRYFSDTDDQRDMLLVLATRFMGLLCLGVTGSLACTRIGLVLEIIVGVDRFSHLR